MRKQTPVMVRVNPNLKKMSDEVFRQLGMNTHAGINLFLAQMVLYQKLPFDVGLHDPNHQIMTDEKTVTIMIKTDENTKKRCAELARNAGLNLSRVIQMYLVQVVDKRAIPFAILSNERSE